MKVMLVNGSSRRNGCTGTALRYIADTLAQHGIETETVWIGNAPLPDCTACGKCRELGHCVFGDIADEVGRRAAEFDGFIFGCPVYYAHPSARLLAVMDRAFYSNGNNFAFKPAAAISSARRNGQVATMDVINKHFSISQMPIVSSNYWNHIFAAEPEEVVQDEEGVQTMINLATNMAWLLKCIELGKQNGIDHPNNPKIATNFTRR